VFLEAFHHNLSRYSISGSRPFIIAVAWYHCHRHQNLLVIFPSLHCPSSIEASNHLCPARPTVTVFHAEDERLIDIILSPRKLFLVAVVFFPPSASSFHPSHRSRPIHPRPASAQDLLFHFPPHWVRILCRWLLDLLFLLRSLLIPYVLPLIVSPGLYMVPAISSALFVI
jgi:hypothetical protein